jgi:hypothetical protein
MKKYLLLFVSLMLFISVFSFKSYAAQEVSLVLNDEAVGLGMSLVFKNQRTMVTLNSDFFTKAGAAAVFDEETETITIDGMYSTVEFTVGEKSALIHRKYDLTGIPETVEMDVAPFLLDDVVYVPLRFAAEGLGALVKWDGVNRTILVTFEEEAKVVPVERPVEYKEINISELSDEDGLYSWVMENRRNTGFYHKAVNNTDYILISAGEKSTGGYSLKIKSVTLVSPDRIYIVAELNEPSPGMPVTQAFTYPCKLIAVEGGGKLLVDGIILGSSDGDAEEVVFETVSPEDIAADEELSSWVNRFYQQAGIHVRHKDEYIYALIAAGQKNTGGYSVTVDRIVKEKSGDAYIYAAVQSPDPDMMVIQVITWPYTVIRFERAGIKQVHGEIQGSSPVNDVIVSE